MTTQFSPRELVLRVQAILRRAAAPGTDATAAAAGHGAGASAEAPQVTADGTSYSTAARMS